MKSYRSKQQALTRECQEWYKTGVTNLPSCCTRAGILRQLKIAFVMTEEFRLEGCILCLHWRSALTFRLVDDGIRSVAIESEFGVRFSNTLLLSQYMKCRHDCPVLVDCRCHHNGTEHSLFIKTCSALPPILKKPSSSRYSYLFFSTAMDARHHQ